MKHRYTARCPHCDSYVAIDMGVNMSKATVETLERFPKMWKDNPEHSGKSFASVWILDREYMIDIMNDDSIKPPLKDGLDIFKAMLINKGLL